MTRPKVFLQVLLVYGILFFLSANSAAAGAAERLLNFTSDIVINSDGSMTVSETITVQAAGREIKRGIYRDFPLRYQDRSGAGSNVDFKVLEVRRNDAPEAYHLKKRSHGVRVYIGQKNRMLQPGEHRYTLTYHTDRQLGFFEQFDELYWNVTGNGWAFPIDRVQATVILPPNANVLAYAGYTGLKGARGNRFTVDNDDSGHIRFTTDRVLGKGEGLTIAVSWPKGYVVEPTLSDRVGYFFGDNPGAVAALIGVAVLLGYYLFAWVSVGRDPAAGAIIPRFGPPKGYSPAAVRFVDRMGFDHKAFAAAIVDMAVKGCVKIEEDDGDYRLIRTGADEAALSGGEKRILKKLFRGGRTIDLDNANHKSVKAAISALKISLKLDFEKQHFRRNAKWLIPGAVVSVLTLTALVLKAHEIGGTFFMLIWLSGWSAGCVVLVVAAFHAWRSAFTGGTFKTFSALGVTLFALPFLGFEGFGIWALANMASPFTVIALMAVIVINLLFYQLIKAPTLYGRRIMDRIEGFKLYLSVAEKEGLAMRHPPEKTPELFEKFLSFALALDVENAWSEQFSDVLARAQHREAYTPSWYTGTNWRTIGARGFAVNLGSAFSSTISAASSPPGSSSGSGGGGSSGGGGGGGGGGGW